MDLAAPDPTAADVEDIFWTLARICRFTAHVRYSVGEHSLLVAHAASHKGIGREGVIKAFTHDFHEAYVNDINRPLMRCLSESAQAEIQAVRDRLQRAIEVAVGIGQPTAVEAAIIDECDGVVLAAEAHALFPFEHRRLADWQLPECRFCDYALAPDIKTDFETQAWPYGLSADMTTWLMRRAWRRLMASREAVTA